MLFEKKHSGKLYILVRQDISLGYQIAQSIHAKDDFTHDYPEIENEWYRDSNVIVVLGVPDVKTLFLFVDQAQALDLKSSLFYEEDIPEYTALAIEPGVASSRLVSGLNPAGGKLNRII